MREATPNGSRLYAHAHHESHAYFTSFTQYAKVVYSLYSCFAIYRFIHVRPVKRSMLSTRNKMQWNSKMLGVFTDKTMKISPDVHSRGRLVHFPFVWWKFNLLNIRFGYEHFLPAGDALGFLWSWSTGWLILSFGRFAVFVVSADIVVLWKL